MAFLWRKGSEDFADGRADGFDGSRGGFSQEVSEFGEDLFDRVQVGGILGGLAEFERELIRTRTGEGRERAKARGVVLGRKPKLSPHQRREALARREAGEVLTDIARTYNVSHSTISRL